MWSMKPNKKREKIVAEEKYERSLSDSHKTRMLNGCQVHTKNDINLYMEYAHPFCSILIPLHSWLLYLSVHSIIFFFSLSVRLFVVSQKENFYISHLRGLSQRSPIYSASRVFHSQIHRPYILAEHFIGFCRIRLPFAMLSLEISRTKLSTKQPRFINTQSKSFNFLATHLTHQAYSFRYIILAWQTIREEKKKNRLTFPIILIFTCFVPYGHFSKYHWCGTHLNAAKPERKKQTKKKQNKRQFAHFWQNLHNSMNLIQNLIQAISNFSMESNA